MSCLGAILFANNICYTANATTTMIEAADGSTANFDGNAYFGSTIFNYPAAGSGCCSSLAAPRRWGSRCHNSLAFRR
jgi:hypothetical protein